MITTPDCVQDDYGPKHVKYPSYKALAFLHPKRFTPDRSVLAELGVAPDDRYFLVRFVAFAASHDRRAAGLAPDVKRSLVDRLRASGRVFVSSEAPLPPELQPLAFPAAPHRLHDALAFATLCVTDGQSMAGEAAVLGVPSVRLATSCGRLDVFRELSTRYGLVFEFRPGEEADFLRTVEDLARRDRSRWAECRRRLLEEKCDLTTWLLELLSTLPTRART